MENNGQTSTEDIEIEDFAPHLDPEDLKDEAERRQSEQSGAERPKSCRTFAGIDAAELANYVDAETDWLVDGIFAADQPTVFGAASKATKTTQLVDLAVSLASCTSWLGNFSISKRRKVLFITGESNYRAVSKRILRALRIRGLSWSDVSGWLRVEAIEFPCLPDVIDKDAIQNDVQEYGIDVVIIDPLYRGLQGLDTHRMAEMGEAIISFVRACQPASVIISHHIIKTAAREMGTPALEDLSGAGLAESAGNWWLIGRNGPYQFDGIHDLSVVFGGRDEQAGVKRIVFNEAEWKFEISSGKDLKAQRKREAEERKRQEQQTKVDEAKAAIRHALANEKQAKPKSWIEQRSGSSQASCRIAIAELLNDGILVNQTYRDTLNRPQEGLILATMATSSPE